MTSYKVAAIDVHKRMLAVVVADVGKDEWEFERRKFGTAASELKALEEWLAAREVCEAVMESTAQYWKPVWQQLEGRYGLHWRKHIRIGRRAAGSVILKTPSDSCDATWLAS